MSLELLVSVLSTFLLAFICYIVGRIVLALAQIRPTTLMACGAPLVGLAVLALQLWLYGLVGLPWVSLLLLMPWLGVVVLCRRQAIEGIAFERALLVRAWQGILQLNTVGRGALVVMAALLFAYLLSLALEPITTSDVLAFWGYKAQEFFRHQQVYVSPELGASHFFHVDYPPLLPLMANVAYVLFGHLNETYLKTLQFIFALSGVSALVIFLRSRLPQARQNLAIMFGFLLVAAPQFLPMLFYNKYMAYADYPLAITMLLSAIFFIRTFGRPLGGEWWLALIFASIAGVIKNEGTAFLAIMLVLLGGRYIFALFTEWRQRMWWPIVRTLALTAAILAPLAIWAHFKLQHGFTPEFKISNLEASHMTLVERLHLILYYAKIYLKDSLVYQWQVVGLALACLATLFSRWSCETWVAGLVTIGMIGAYTTSYVLSPHSLDFHVLSSMDRLLAQVLPLQLLWMGLLVTYAVRRRDNTEHDNIRKEEHYDFIQKT